MPSLKGYFSEIGPPNGTCVVPATWELVIPTENGRVIGAVLKYAPAQPIKFLF